MANIAVTGGNGFIGGHIVDELQNAKHNVFIIDVLQGIKKKNNFFKIDINDTKNLEKCFIENKIEYVFHIAAIANARQSIEDPVQTIDINVKGTASVLFASHKAQVKKVILASTVWVFNACEKDFTKSKNITLDETALIKPEGGKHFYTTSKLVSELLCQDFSSLKNLKFTILRYGIPYGPNMWKGLVLRSFVENALGKKPLNIIGDGTAKRRFIHVSDLAKAHLLSLSEKADNQIFNIEGNNDVTIGELANLVAQNIENTSVNFTEDSTRKGELNMDNFEISNLKAKKLLNWEPKIEIKQGVKDYIDWYKSNNS
ncbi:MAG: hypothetical protein CBC24_03320 [Candidatus Pelagibacter sp. TMED64]|nr:UDP-glucose 4-epimerase [Candidatus Pelagibacter sp.]OUU66372.1 MAG: hypothetical protein CBC24_03320 [Candidatus Pelagibacter sp. TMED64]|tara:strand:- start:1045 stop:1989 length:945 start_codon:yes stop_codon:yes gene_type:complete